MKIRDIGIEQANSFDHYSDNSCANNNLLGFLKPDETDASRPNQAVLSGMSSYNPAKTLHLDNWVISWLPVTASKKGGGLSVSGGVLVSWIGVTHHEDSINRYSPAGQLTCFGKFLVEIQ